MLIGFLGADPESKTTKSGKTVCTITVAVDETWTGADSSKNKKTEWIKVVTWGPLAVNCERYLKKGRKVYVEGKFRTNVYEDSNGVKKYSTYVDAKEVGFFDSAPKNENEAPNFENDKEIPF